MKRSTWLKLAVLTLVLVGVGLAARAAGFDVRQISPERIRRFVLSYGMWGPVIYLAIYGQPIVPLPATILILAGGAAFGPGWGCLAATSGAMLRASSQFGLARLLGREAVQRFLKGRAAQLDEQLAANALRAVLLFRLIPNIPFDMQNFLFGFSKVRFGPYFFGTLLGILPIITAYTYLGSSLSDPHNGWKLGLAILLIIGLVVLQRRWQARRSKAGPACGPVPAHPSSLANSPCL